MKNQCLIEAMEPRRLFNVSMLVTGENRVLIIGDDAANNVIVERNAHNDMVVKLVNPVTGAYDLLGQRSFAQVERIIVNLHGGDDKLTVRDEVKRGMLIYVGDGNDTVYAGSGNDTIYGGAGHDALRGGRGADSIYGEAGNDTLMGGNYEADLLDGGAGRDTADYAGNPLGLRLFANGHWESGSAGERDCVTTIFENFIGGQGHDLIVVNQLTGGEAHGGFGNDSIYGSNFNDKLFGGPANDLVHAGKGHDTLVGGAGDDRLYARDGKTDLIFGGEMSGQSLPGYDVAQVDEGYPNFDILFDIDAKLT